MANLTPINSVDLKGETIKQELFLSAGGSEKTILIFESGKVLVLPIYRECSVQVGTIEDLRTDFDAFIENLEAEKRRTIDEIDGTIKKIKEL